MKQLRSVSDIGDSGVERDRYTPSPRDWRDRVMYLLMVDRFDNDDSDVPPFDPETADYGRDPDQRSLFQGGRISGVTRRLDYLKELGIQAIWLTPVLKNRQSDPHSYHGYGIQNFLDVDPRFGSMEDLQHLVNEAHAREIAIVLDIVLNHTGDVWYYPDDGGRPFADEAYDFGGWREADEGQDEMDGRVWPVEFQNPDWFRRQGEIQDDADPNQLVRGDVTTFKTLDTSNDEVLGALIECYKFWISATDCDGFRVDTVRNMEPRSVAIVCNALREHAYSLNKKNFLIFGEIIGDEGVIADYMHKNPDVEGDRDRLEALGAALDYPLYFVLESVIKGHVPPAHLRDKLKARVMDAPVDESSHWITFIDNHDQPNRCARFLHDNQYDQQAALAVAYLLTTRGIPCIYYGTEQGFDGGGDDPHYLRECMFGGGWGAFDTTGMHFFNTEHPLYQAIAKVAYLRANEPALRYGRQYFRGTLNGEGAFELAKPGGTLAYSRVLDDDELLVALNLAAEHREDAIEVDPARTPSGGRMRDLLSGSEHDVQRDEDGHAFVRVPLEGHQISILKAI